MEVKERLVVYFEEDSGRMPVREWLSKLKDVKGRARIDVRIRRAGLGNFGDYKSVGDSVLELRIHHGPGYRVYLSVVNEDEVLLLLVGGDKSSQRKNIEQAKQNLNEWRKRNETK